MSEEGKNIYSGHLLKQARKRKRRKYTKLSSELRIPEKYLEALENDDYSSLPGSTYVRGYLRSYAKKLDLDPEIVIGGYERYLKDRRREEKTENKKEKTQHDKKSTPLILLFVLIFFCVISLLFFLNSTGEPKILGKEINELNLENQQVKVENVLSSAVKDTSIIPIQDRLDIEEENKIQSKVSLTRQINLDLRKETKQVNILRLSFFGECWIEILEKDSVLEYKLAKAGTALEIRGKGPFKVILGDSRKAKLFYNDKQINLSPTTNTQTNVSCLVLPKGRCSEFALSNRN